ncbi:hypothetical protein CCMA1212_000475 [Trichoderma ghanense]|uniref:Transposase n=1 Tax=Trichoderma ghanense TaxID=65468 RepID=A0ABY2HEI1_9HYPO
MDPRVGIRVHGAKLPLALQVDLPVYAIYGAGVAAGNSTRSRGEKSTRHGADAANGLCWISGDASGFDVDGVDVRSRWKGPGKKSKDAAYARRHRSADPLLVDSRRIRQGVVDACFKLLRAVAQGLGPSSVVSRQGRLPPPSHRDRDCRRRGGQTSDKERIAAL